MKHKETKDSEDLPRRPIPYNGLFPHRTVLRPDLPHPKPHAHMVNHRFNGDSESEASGSQSSVNTTVQIGRSRRVVERNVQKKKRQTYRPSGSRPDRSSEFPCPRCEWIFVKSEHLHVSVLSVKEDARLTMSFTTPSITNDVVSGRVQGEATCVSYVPKEFRSTRRTCPTFSTAPKRCSTRFSASSWS